jgi:hypothetical protein
MHNRRVEEHPRYRTLALTLAALLAACGTTGTATTSTSPQMTTSVESTQPPEWLDLSLRYSFRHSQGKRRLDVVTANNGTEQVVITSIALHADHFTELPAEAKTSRIPPGLTVAVKTDFGEVADCAASGPLDASVALTLLIGESETEQSLDIPVDPEPLDVIRANDCNALLASDAVDVSFAEEWTVDNGAVLAELIVARDKSSEPITVASVRGMILYGLETLTPSEDIVGVIEPEESELRIPVRLTLARCDVHAVSQAPDGYSFRVWVGIGDGEPILTTVKPDGPLQEELEAIVLDCVDAENAA